MVTLYVSDGDLCYTERDLDSPSLLIRFCGHLSYDQNYTAMSSQTENFVTVPALVLTVDETVNSLINKLMKLSAKMSLSGELLTRVPELVTVIDVAPIHNMFLMFNEEDSIEESVEVLVKQKKKTRRGKRPTAAKRCEKKDSESLKFIEDFVVDIVTSAYDQESFVPLSEEMNTLCELAALEVMLVPDSMVAFPTNVSSFERYQEPHPWVSQPIRRPMLCNCVFCKHYGDNRFNVNTVSNVHQKQKFVPKNEICFGSFPPVETRANTRPNTPVEKPVLRRSKSFEHKDPPPFRFGFYRFDDYFFSDEFRAGWTIRDNGVNWYMYEYAGKRWCISNKLRNRAAHATNGNGSCFSVSVTVTNEPCYTYAGAEVKPRKMMKFVKSKSEMAYEDELFFGIVSPPRSSDNKKANKKAHADNGNGSRLREGNTENVNQSGNEIDRDIESTVESFDRSNIIDVQAIKAPDENIPSEITFLNPNTKDLVYRRVQLAKVSLNSETAVDTALIDLDPFLKYYNATLNHNSSMSTFRDVYFDLEFDVVVQALPAMAGICHFVFDRFGGTGDEQGVYSTEQLFAFPTQILDLSSKDSLNFTVTMELPYRVFNTVKTPYAGLGCGILKMFLATPMVVPAQMVMPATITLFARAVNVKPFNLMNRRSLRLESALTPLDGTTEQSMTFRAPAQNSMKPVDIAREWGFVSRTPIPNESPVGFEVCNIDLHPDEHDTPLSEVASAYSYYRGSIRIRLTVNLSKFQAITLAAVFVPEDASFEPALYEAYAFQEIVFDEKHEAVLNVQYAAGSNWLPIIVAKGENRRASFGKLYIILRSQLVSTAPYGSVPTLLVEMAAGEDFEVAHPRDYSKDFKQPPLLEMNPEVPRTFLSGSTNLYQDARLPVYYARLKLVNTPWCIPVNCTYSNGGVLGLLKNTHAGWSGSIDYYIEFEGEGQAEIRYDPTKRVEDGGLLQNANMMPTAGYCRMINSRTNPLTHLSVPFCSLYDYLPTRKSGMSRTLNNSNCNGCLLIQGTGFIRIYRAAGKDFKVHFYNSIHKFNPEPVVQTISSSDYHVRDSITQPNLSTVKYQVNYGALFESNEPRPSVERSNVDFEIGFGGISETVATAANLVNQMEFDIPEAVENIRQAGSDVSALVSDLYETVPPVIENARTTIDDVASLVPEIRDMVKNGNKTFGDVSSVTDAICSLLSGPTRFAQSIISASKGCISTIKQMILSIHGSISQIIQQITPKCVVAIVGTVGDIWSTMDMAMVYAVATVCAAMAMGVANKWAIAGTLAVIGCSIPSMCDTMDKLFDLLTNPLSASAAKESVVEMQSPPSAIACGASLLASIITFFIPSKDWGLKGTGEMCASIAKIFSGAKSIDEMLSSIYDMIVKLPYVEKLLGKTYGTVAILTQVDIEAYVSEVQELMCTDFYNTALTTEKVRQQERLWKTHNILQKHLVTMTKTNFFFNQIMRKVMDEQQKMYHHAMAFKGAGRERFPPYICMFTGATRVGKSTIAQEIMNKVCTMMDWNPDTDIYTRQPSDPYFSGLAQQKIFYVDDLHTNITSNGADSDMSMVMSFATNAAFAPNMAALHDKGRTVNALLGMFCTNIPGEPSHAGIRNVPAYLARRHMLVLCRRKPGTYINGKPQYFPDYSHNDFILLNPHDRMGVEELDENMNPVGAGRGKCYTYPEIWEMFSTGFLKHLARERLSRHQRQQAGAGMKMPEGDLLDVARELADHYDDVDYVDVAKVQNLELQAPTYTQMTALAGTHKKYHDLLKKLDEIEVCNAIGDVVYIPDQDTFIWKQINSANQTIFEKLVDLSADADPVSTKNSYWDTDRVRNDIKGYIDVMSEITDEEEYEEFFSVVPEIYHDIISAAVRRRKELRESAMELTKIKNKNWKEVLRQVYDGIPKWFKALLAAFTMGGAIYLGVAGLKKIFSMVMPGNEVQSEPQRPFVVAEPQYERPVAPALNIPIKKTAMAVPIAEYANELAPALGINLQKARAVPVPQYANELAPALGIALQKAKAVPVPQYAKDISPAMGINVKRAMVVPSPQISDEPLPELSVEVKKATVEPIHEVVLPEVEREVPVVMLEEETDAGRIMVSYEENPRAVRQQVGSKVTMESQAQIQNTLKLYKHNRCGKIRQTVAGFSLHFLFLDDRTILCNRHFFTVMGGINPGEGIELFWRSPDGVMTFSFSYDPKRAHPVPKTDVAVYALPQAIEGIRSSWNLIASEAELMGVMPDIGVLITYDDEMDFFPQKLNSVRRRTAGETLNSYINLDGTKDVVNGTTIYLDGFGYISATAGGYCGSLLTLPNAGGKVFGIHSACVANGKDSGNGIASFVSKEMLEIALKNNEPMMPPYSDPANLPAPVYEKRDGAVKVILQLEIGFWEPMIDVTPYGLPVVAVLNPLEATTGSMFTAYKHSPLNRFFPTEPYRVPATLRPGDKRNPYPYDPRPDILGKYNKKISPLPADKLAVVVEHLTTQFQQLYHPYKPSEFLDFEQAINGVPNAPYYDAINFHTSPGLPYSQQGFHKKASMFVEDGIYSNGMPRRVCTNDLCATRYSVILDTAKQGYMVNDVVFQEFMKDELLKRQKIYEKPATRGIANPPLDLLLAERAAFLPFIALLQYNRHEIDCQVGINPMSGSEWTEMIHRLKSNSDLVFDADYTAFDSTIHPTVLDAFADIANGTMGGNFYTQLGRKTLIRYVYDRVSQVTNVQVKIDQGMASGMPMTAVGNSLVNMIYLRVAWLMLAEEQDIKFRDLQQFDKHVKAIVYGDDNVVTVKAEVASWYNLKTIALCLEPFGILMTDGQKNPRDQTQPFSNWEDVRFLKRAFKLDERTGLYMAPLEKKTIVDRIRYVKAKAWWEDLEIRCQMSLEDCMFHGQEYFEAMKFFINDCMREIQKPAFTVSYTRERSKWEAASCMLSMEAPNEIYYARDDNAGGVEVFYALEGTAPTRMNNRWVLPLSGPRQPIGRESNTLGFWHAPRSTGPPPPPITFTGGVTLQQLQNELDRRPCQGISLQQLQNELDRRPSQGGGITLQQLQNELDRRPSQDGGLTIQQLREELRNVSSTGGGVTVQQLRNELEQAIPQHVRNRAPGLITNEEMQILLENFFWRIVNSRQPQVTPILPPQVVPPVTFPPHTPGGRRLFTAGRRGIVDSWNEGLVEEFYYDGDSPAVLVIDGEKFRTRAFAAYWTSELEMSVHLEDQREVVVLDRVREVSVSSGIAASVRTRKSGWGGLFSFNHFGRKFDVKIPLGGDSEIGNFQHRTGNQESQVQERLSLHPGKWTLHEIAGRKFYQMHRGNHNDMVWPWIIIHWNCTQILELLGARNVPKFACSHGRYEWDHMSEYTVNIADALFGRRRHFLPSTRRE